MAIALQSATKSGAKKSRDQRLRKAEGLMNRRSETRFQPLTKNDRGGRDARHRPMVRRNRAKQDRRSEVLVSGDWLRY